jgi:6-phosphogluconate dehydrogenase (decarboxylating)
MNALRALQKYGQSIRLDCLRRDKNPGLASCSGVVGDSGERRWTIDAAIDVERMAGSG